MNVWNAFSLLLEIGVAVLGWLMALHKGKFYGWLIMLTFAIYVIYDLSRFLEVGLAPVLLDMLLAIASLSAFFGVWGVYSHEK